MTETVEGFSLEQCRKDYCSTGLQGYENFISVLVIVYRENMRVIGCLMALFVIMQLVQAANMYELLKQVGRENEMDDDKDFDEEFGSRMSQAVSKRPTYASRGGRTDVARRSELEVGNRQTNAHRNSEREGWVGVTPAVAVGAGLAAKKRAAGTEVTPRVVQVKSPGPNSSRATPGRTSSGAMEPSRPGYGKSQTTSMAVSEKHSLAARKTASAPKDYAIPTAASKAAPTSASTTSTTVQVKPRTRPK